MTTEQINWTFGRFYNRIKQDCKLLEDDDLQESDEQKFISFDGIVGLTNSAIDEAEAEIHLLNEDYFLTSDYVPLIQGQKEYDLPIDIYANKIRKVMYARETEIYEVQLFRPLTKFDRIAVDNQYAHASEAYKYFIKNSGPNRKKMILNRPASETAVLPPEPNPFTPMERWYLRQAARIPLLDEYVISDEILPSAVDTDSNTLTVAPEIPYITGDKVMLTPLRGGQLPEPLSAGVVYFVIRLSDTQIRLATSLANARSATAIDLTSQGTGLHRIRVAATKSRILQYPIDIPEFVNFLIYRVEQWVWEADGDPRALKAQEDADKYKEQMIAALKNAVVDDEQDRIEMDLTHYEVSS